MKYATVPKPKLFHRLNTPVVAQLLYLYHDNEFKAFILSSARFEAQAICCRVLIRASLVYMT